MAKKTDKLLLINLHGLGDNIMMTPTVRALKKAAPGRQLYLLVSGELRALYDFWSTNPYIEKVFVSRLDFHPRFWDPVKFYLHDYWSVMREARGIAHEYGIGRILLIRNQYLPEFLDRRVSFWPQHRVDRIAFEAGAKLDSFQYDVFWKEQHEARTSAFFEKYKLTDAPMLVGLHTMPSGGNRAWNLCHAREVTRQLHEQYGARFIHFHSQKSYELECGLQSVRLDNDLVQETASDGLDILTTAALVSRCQLTLAVDSALAYLASACRVPLVLLCHPKNPVSTRLPKEGTAVGADAFDFTPALVMGLIKKLGNLPGWTSGHK